jgi:hypothetical protein
MTTAARTPRLPWRTGVSPPLPRVDRPLTASRCSMFVDGARQSWFSRHLAGLDAPQPCRPSRIGDLRCGPPEAAACPRRQDELGPDRTVCCPGAVAAGVAYVRRRSGCRAARGRRWASVAPTDPFTGQKSPISSPGSVGILHSDEAEHQLHVHPVGAGPRIALCIPILHKALADRRHCV